MVCRVSHVLAKFTKFIRTKVKHVFTKKLNIYFNKKIEYL